MVIETLKQVSDRVVEEIPSGKSNNSEEWSFRRGYVQAYSAALDAMESGKTAEEMNEFFNTQLQPWREDKIDQFLPPKIN